MYGKGFLGNMTENLHADCVQSRQAGFIQYFPKYKYTITRPVCHYFSAHFGDLCKIERESC